MMTLPYESTRKDGFQAPWKLAGREGHYWMRYPPCDISGTLSKSALQHFRLLYALLADRSLGGGDHAHPRR